MLDEIAIVQRACNRVGIKPPESLSANDKLGLLCLAAFEEEAAAALELYPWSFAKDIFELSRTTEKPIAGYGYIHLLPSGDHIMQLERVTARPDYPDRNFTDYKKYGDRIHSNEVKLFAEMRTFVKPHLWSALFVKAVTVAVAGHIIEAVASDSKRANELQREAYGPPSERMRGGLIGSAMQADAGATPNRRMRLGRNPLTQAWES